MPDARILESYDNSLSLKDEWKLWADKILSVRNGRILDNEYIYNKISEHGYEIKSATIQLEKLFEQE